MFAFKRLKISIIQTSKSLKSIILMYSKVMGISLNKA